MIPMRVLHLCWAYPSPQFPEYGSFLRNILEPISAAGVDADVATPLPYIPKHLGRFFVRTRRAALLSKRYEFNGIQVLVPRYMRLPHALVGDHLPAMLAHAVGSVASQKPDIVHAHYAYPFGIAALELRRKWRVPVVLTLHGSDAAVFPYQSETNRNRFVQAVLNADHVLAVSEDIVDRTRDLTGRTVQFWPIGVNLARFRSRNESKAEIRQRLGLPNKKLILFVGALHKAKGVDQVPALVDRLGPEFHAVLVGDGPIRSQLQSSSGCTWVPPIANESVAEYLNAADLMILPSETEGTPTVLVEAGAARLPVVATPVGGIPALLADDRGLLVEVRNMDSMVAAVKATLANAKASAQRAQRLHAYVTKNYDCVENGRRLKQLYAEVSANAAPDPVPCT
jgi:teichuronic acid biosynthesis glycosyltransferase TuaC